MRVFVLSLLVFFTLQSHAIAQHKPLVVVRFFDENIRYERSLYQAVSKALDANPKMVFDLVVFSPAGQAGHTNRARHYGQRVMASLQEMGLLPHRTTISYQQTPHATVPEVHLFVR